MRYVNDLSKAVSNERVLEATSAALARADGKALSELGYHLTSHLSFKENKVLKKNTIQMSGQMMRPSQKMRASASVAAIWFGEACEGRRESVFRMRETGCRGLVASHGFLAKDFCHPLGSGALPRRRPQPRAGL